MGLKTIPTKLFLEYIKFLGLVYIRNQGSSHHIYNYKGVNALNRPIVIRINEKEIPILHIHTNLKTVDPLNGKRDFEIWLKNNR